MLVLPGKLDTVLLRNVNEGLLGGGCSRHISVDQTSRVHVTLQAAYEHGVSGSESSSSFEERKTRRKHR